MRLRAATLMLVSVALFSVALTVIALNHGKPQTKIERTR